MEYVAIMINSAKHETPKFLSRLSVQSFTFVRARLHMPSMSPLSDVMRKQDDHTRRRFYRGPWLRNNHKLQPIPAPGTMFVTE